MDQTSQSEKVFQKQKFDEIIEILLSAGYFRARINTLSEFDKVVGGLCWCITNSGEDVDVDILFQENSTIGQRIALSEAIVKALRKMNCPAPLQAHQIQGGVGHLSDFPAIHPVIVWLVKKCIQRKEEQEFQLRSFATLQFSKNYEIPTESDLNNVSIDLQKILARNKAVRQFKRRQLKDDAEETRIHSCLLEFGESVLLGKGQQGSGSGAPGAAGGADAKGASSSKAGGKSGSAGVNGLVQITMKDLSEISLSSISGKAGGSEQLSGFEKKLAQAARDAQREEQMFAEHAQREEEAIMKQMTEVSGPETVGALTGSQVGAIVGMGSSEIGSAAAAYALEVEESRKQMEANLASGKLGQAAAYKRQRANLVKQSDDMDVRQGECQANLALIAEKLRVVEEDRDGAMDYIAQLNVQIQKLKDLEAASTQQEELAMLKKLVALNESLRAQEAAFKASCKAQMADYNARMAALTAADGEDDEEAKKLRGIEEMHAKMTAKYDRLRQLLAETNLEIANTSRAIDDVPTRTELIQYERRFSELYQQVAWKLEETRKYYAMYNTLDSTLGFLQKEVKLLNSISENFGEAMKSPSSKAEFAQQFEIIVKGVEESMIRQENMLLGKEQRVDQLKSVLQNLVDEQRRYFKAVKDFQDECNKNEWLSSKLEQLTAQ